MHGPRFDRLTRSIFATVSRRQIARSLLLGAIALDREAAELVAGPGCKNVSRKCKRAKQCCSGVSKGKKGKKGCKAHDTGGCRAGQDTCAGTPIPCVTSTGYEDGLCFTTTGNAGYCSGDTFCVACAKDADCRGDFGPKAACVVCGTCDDGTACVQPDDIM